MFLSLWYNFRILDVFSTHKDVFENLGFDVVAQQVESVHCSTVNHFGSHSSHIQCCINPDILFIPQSYRLHISSQKVCNISIQFSYLPYK